MKIRSGLCLIGLGIGGTLLYQEIKSGRFKKMVRQMNKTKTKLIEDLEESM